MDTDRGPNPPPVRLRRSDGKPDGQPDGPGRLVGLGFQFAGAIVLCVLAGQWADRRFGTDPWGVLSGAVVGFAAGFYALVKAARRDTGDGVGGEAE
jgi:F0F1-type ATP synthase assembly protein I